MSRAYSIDLRERVVAAMASGASARVAAARFGVSVASAVRWSQRHRRTGAVAPGKLGGHRNRNLLIRANRELGMDFEPDAFAHVAVWNAEHSRMEMHLRSIRDQHVAIGDTVIAFSRGETIHTESSRKYTRASVTELAEAAGWTVSLFEESADPSVALALLRA